VTGVGSVLHRREIIVAAAGVRECEREQDEPTAPTWELESASIHRLD
jgi:hypothetical protein